LRFCSGGMEQVVVSSPICGQLQINGCRTCRSSSYDYVAWVASELANVALNPLESFSLVFQSIVDGSVFRDFLAGNESIWTNAVVKVDDYNVEITCSDQATTIVVGIRVCVEASTLDEEIDG